MAATTVTVLYPSGADAKFDMEYYMSKHMPLVQAKWGSEGLKSWEVTKYIGTAQKTEPPYSVLATLNFESTAKFEAAATGPGGAAVMGDIKNFSNKDPIIIIGDKVKPQ